MKIEQPTAAQRFVDEPGREKRPGPGCAKTHLQGDQNKQLRRKSSFSFGNLVKAAKKVASGTHPAQGLPWQAVSAMTSSTYNDTPAQPQPQAMGAARRDPRGSEMLGRDRQGLVFLLLPKPGEVVSNAGSNRNQENSWFQKPQGSPCPTCQPYQAIQRRNGRRPLFL